ncbi:MAG: SDR family NAD(P)-dependent oxidoreductase [Candidatus Kaiserbacteria bacterium]|nr:SDR family NAD(P)-dependent oxidoreductase [Candidatus Kaiserbacteria bacterium]
MEQKPISELMNLSGKVAIVTGGAMGIGYAIASRLAEAGAKVLVADKDAAAAETAAAKIGTAAIVADVSDEAQVEAMIAKAVAEFGGVDILVNNAGIYPQKPVLEATKEDFEKTIHTNLMGAFFAAKIAAKQMIAQGRGGKIINITSIDALHPSSVGLAFYDASKHGLWGFTKNLALELAPHKIWINAIAPGGVATPGTGLDAPIVDPVLAKIIESFVGKIPMHRMADADEIGKVALFLASDLSSYMTGSQIVVDGGVLLA